MVYNLVYTDGNSGRTYVKRFNVLAITRDKEKKYNFSKFDTDPNSTKSSDIIEFSKLPFLFSFNNITTFCNSTRKINNLACCHQICTLLKGI